MRLKKLFSFILFALLTVSVAWANNVYVKVTDPSQLLDSNGNPKKVILAHVYTGTGTTNDGYVTIAGAFRNGQELTSVYKKPSSVSESMDIDVDNFSGASEFILGKVGNTWTIKQGDSFVGFTTGSALAQITNGEDETIMWTLTSDNGGYILKNASGISIKQMKYNGAFKCLSSNYYDAYLYVQKGADDPELTTSESTINIGSNPYKTFTVSGSNLTGPISISVKDGSTNGFNVTPTTITPEEDGSVTDAEVTVSYRGSVSEAKGYIVLECGNIIKEVKVNSYSSLGVSPSSLALGTSPSSTFAITGANLANNVSIALKDGSDNGFSVTPETVEVVDGIPNNATVTVSYNGTEPNAAATFIVTSGDLIREVNVTASHRDVLFTTAGNYYIQNQSTHNYVQLVNSTLADVTATTQDDADIITLDFKDGNISVMEQYDGDGDMIATLDLIKRSMKEVLEDGNKPTDFLDQMFTMKMVMTGEDDGSVYLVVDVPSTLTEEIIDYLIEHSGGNQAVNFYLSHMTPGKRHYLCVDGDDTFGFTRDNGTASRWLAIPAEIPEDVLFTTPGNYYVSNKGNNKYVVVNGTYDAEVSADKDNASIITLDFADDNTVSIMEQYDGDGDVMATLKTVKRVLKEKLGDLISDETLDDIFEMKLVDTGDGDGSVYLSFDIPTIENIEAVRAKVEETVNNAIVKEYLNQLLQPRKRVYMCVNSNDESSLTFTRDKGKYSKWMVEEAEIPEDVLFTTPGNYKIQNKGKTSNNYVLITGTNAAEVTATEETASIIELDFNEDGTVKAMKNHDGEGDVMATLVTVKSVLKNKLGDLISDETLDEIFAMKLVDTGDGDGSVFLCLNIPRISNIDAIRAKVEETVNDATIKEYLNVILQPRKRVYVSLNSDDKESVYFTLDNDDYSKWMVEKAPDNLFTTPGNYYISNKGNSKYVVVNGTTAAEVSASDKDNATLITIAFSEDGTVSTMKQHDGDADVMATLVTVKEVLENKLSGFNTDFIDEMFKMRLVDTGDGDGSVFLCMDIPANIEDIDGIRAAVTNNVSNAQIKEYLLTLLQPGKRIYVCVNNGDKVGFTLSSDDYSKWMAEKGPDDLFTEAGSYYINNKGNTKYVVVTGTTAAEVTAETEDDATIIDLAFNEDGTISTMKNHNGEGDVMITLETVKSVLKNKLGDLISDETLDEIFAMKLVDTGDGDGSVFLCLDIPAIANIDDIRAAVESNVANTQVKEYLDVILQPGKRVYLCVNKEDDQSVAFTLESDNYSKWMATKLEKIEINEENFPDPAFRQYVHDNFDLNGNWWLSQAELDLIKIVDVGDSRFIGNDELKANVVSVQGIEFFENLERLYLNGCTKLESVDVSQNKSLSTLKLANTLVSELDLTNNTELRYLDLNDCDNLKEKELDLSTCENIHWIEIGKSQKMTIKGLSGKLNLGRLVAEGNYFEDNVLDLNGCETLTHLNVSGCDLDKLILKGCKNIGTGIGTLNIYSNKLRALDLEGVPGTYKFEHGTGDIAHNSTNTQISPTYKPDVTLIYIDRDKTPIEFTYVVYFRLDNTQSEETEGSFVGSVNAVGPTDFTMDRVKRWIRLQGGHASMTSKDLIVNDDKIEHIKGTKQLSTMGLRDLPEDWAWDNSEVPGEILALGFYSVPQGAEDQTVEGKIAYAYDTKKDVTAQDPVYNGEITAENEFFNTNLGDDEFPFDVNWSVKLTDNPDEVVTGLYNLDLNKEVSKVTYVNLMGVESDRPFEGVNIVVTRYTDGTVSTYKAIK